MKLLENMSIREKDLWAELMIDLLVALYYFPRAMALMAQGDVVMRGSELAGLVGSTIVLAIVVSIIVFGIIHRSGETEHKDERDYRFEARGNLIGYWTLTALLVLLLGCIVLTEYSFPVRQVPFLLEMGPLGVGHLILLALVLTSIVKAGTQLYYYRQSA